MNRVRWKFDLTAPPLKPVDDKEEFAEQLEGLEYAEHLAFSDAAC
ncbi:MAG: hypothetical protein PGN30_11255 [Mycolicibacterium neoaurum]